MDNEHLKAIMQQKIKKLCWISSLLSLKK